MALKPHQKAVLALRIVMARYCDWYTDIEGGSPDVDSEGGGNQNDDALLEAVCGSLKSWIGKTRGEVRDEGNVAAHLRAAAEAVRVVIAAAEARFSADGITAGARKRFGGAADLLDAYAAGAQPGNGDGPALPGPSCTCGILGAAALIEEQARAAYRNAKALRRGFPAIGYETILVEDPRQSLAPFRLDGDANISLTPRQVSIRIEDIDLNAADLCQLAYALFHELVCHAFQAVGSINADNAPASCHWSEGWMDTAAYEMALRWAEEGGKPHRWLPLAGRKVKDAMWELHRARYADKTYVEGSKVSREVARRRSAAREAVDGLRAAFLDNGMASAQDAPRLAETFVLVANAHPDAKSQQLRRISQYLVNALASRERRDRTGWVAAACNEFLHHRKFERLEAALQAAMDA